MCYAARWRNIIPTCIFRVRDYIVYLSGTFPLVDGSQVIDRFLIEIKFPPHYPRGIPIVYEIGRRIPEHQIGMFILPERPVYVCR